MLLKKKVSVHIGSKYLFSTSSPQIASKRLDRSFDDFTHHFLLHCTIFFHHAVALLFVLHSVTLLTNSWKKRRESCATVQEGINIQAH